ncbi:Arginine--tRNA ligase [compost metagenome]
MSVTPREAAGSLERVYGAIGVDAFRLMAVMRAVHLPLELNLAAIADETLDNPAFMLPYTHARLAGLMRLAREAGGFDGLGEGVPSLAADARELLLKLLVYPDVVADAAIHCAPHRVVRYALELAGEFHRFYARHRVFGQPARCFQVGMGLIRGTKAILRHAMGDLCALSTPEQLD